MAFFKIDWLYFPGEEGELWQRAPRSRCDTCGLIVAPFANRFSTPDDDVAHASLILDATVVPPIFRISGLHFVTQSLKTKIEREIRGAFAFVAAEVEGSSEAEKLYWARTTGRLEVKPLYWHIGAPCPTCRHRRQERIEPRPSVPRYEIVSASATGACIYHAEETGAPDFVDADFKEFLEAEAGDYPEQLFSFHPIDCV